MKIKFSILIPAITLCALSGYYIYSAPQEIGQALAAESSQITTTTAITSQPLVTTSSEEPEPQTEPLPETDPLPQLGVEIIVPEELEEQEESDELEILEVPDSTDQQQDNLDNLDYLEDLENLDELIPALPNQDAEVTLPLEDSSSESSSNSQPLDSDIYQLAGSYMSDMGVAVDIAFSDGFYFISLQGMSDSHSSITELTPPSGNTLDLAITLSNLPLTVYLSRDEAGVLSIAAYLSGGAAPMLSATATKVE